ncbi:MAG: LysM peptidoglycan-binding domain-containing protein, partial [Cyclobacteriaceae bacterium]
DRMDPEKSTEAACRFLSYLYNYFGDWELALAGYNSGPGRVNRSIRYADGQRDFRAIYKYFPNETNAYVPKFVDVAYVLNYDEEHNLFPDESLYLPEYDTLEVSQFMNVETFANAAGICLEDLELLNPQIKHSAIPATAKKYPLRIPADLKDSLASRRLELFAAASVGREEIEKLAANEVGAVAGRERVVYKVKSGDVLGSIALRHHVRVSDIKKWNRLSSNTIKIGQTLKIWVLPKYADAASQPVAKAPSKPAPVPRPDQRTHLVANGDTLWDISVAHKISIEDIKSLNNLTGNNIKPGQTLIVSQ